MTARWLIRVASHSRHGGGHLARCTALAAAMETAGAPSLFVLDPNADAAGQMLKQMGFNCCTLGQEGTGPWAGCVLDGYNILRHEAVTWRDLARPMVVIDDFLDPPEGTALAVNSAVHLDGQTIGNIPALLGSRYALVPLRFAEVAERDRTEPVRRVLVTFGRLDPDNLMGMSVDALAELPRTTAVTVVVASESKHLPALQESSARFGDLGNLVLDAPDMLPLLADADLVIGAGGISLMERMAAGVPSITLPIVDNQRLFVDGAARKGGTISCQATTEEGLRRVIKGVLADGTTRQRIADAGRQLVDGCGPDRVAAELLTIGFKSNLPKKIGVPN